MTGVEVGEDDHNEFVSPYRAASGASLEAAKSLEAVIAELSAKSSFEMQLGARLGLAELQLKSGNAAARTRVTDIEKQATDHGVLLLARNAKAAAR